MANIARTSHSSNHSLQLHSFLPHRSFIQHCIFQCKKLLPAKLVYHCQFIPFHFLAFIVPALHIFLELMCQGKNCTPFDTNPVTMWASLSCLLAYCLTYWAGEMTRVRSFLSQCYVSALRCSNVLFGLLLSASLASICFPDIIKPFFYVLCIMFSMGELIGLCQPPRIEEIDFLFKLED